MEEKDSVTITVPGYKSAIGNLFVLAAIGGYPVYDTFTSYRVNDRCGVVSCQEISERLISVEKLSKTTQIIQSRNQLQIDAIPHMQTNMSELVAYYQRHRYDRWRYGDQLQWAEELRIANDNLKVPRPRPSDAE